MDKSNVVVILDHGHCKSTPGKCSPDKSLLEYKYTREIVKCIEDKLYDLGIRSFNTHPEEDFVYKTKGGYQTLDSRDLALRVSRINVECYKSKQQGKKPFLISVHVDASGNGDWRNASGWSVYTTVGQNNSDKLATIMHESAVNVLRPLNKICRKDMRDGDPDFESNFYILKQSNCPCILTENFYMDNKSDIEFLLSEEGKNAIVELHINGILNYINSLK